MNTGHREIRNPYRKRPRYETTEKDEQAEARRSLSSIGVSAADESPEKTAPSPDPAAGANRDHLEHPQHGGEASALVISAADKAGMEGIDRAAIDAIILKESGNSLFMQQQRRRDEKVNARIAAFREKLRLHEERNAASKRNGNRKDWRAPLLKQMDAELIPAWIAARPSRSIKVVVDMDAFYMNCELLSRPDITSDMPACVGGPSMIMTSNYAARRYGVRSAMPGYIGKALVSQLSQGRQQLVFCPSNFELYKTKSLEMKQALSEFDPNLAAYSLDEVYLDLAHYLACSLTHPDWTHEQIAATLQQKVKETTTADQSKDDDFAAADIDSKTNESVLAERLGAETLDDEALDSRESLDVLLSFPTAVCLDRVDSIVADMRNRVRSVTGGLTCSAGVAPNFLLAKIASDRNKPDGQLIVGSEHEKVIEFLNPLPIRKVSGIGRVTEKILNAFGIATVAQLYEERALVRFLFENSSTAGFLLRASVGCSSSDGGKETEEDASSSHQKGISRERTIQAGKTWSELSSKFEDIAQLLSEDMKRKNLSAQTVTVKVKLSTFDMLSRARSLPRGVFVQSAEELLKVAVELLHEIRQKEMNSSSKGKSVSRALFSVRLLGIRCSNLVTDDERRSESANQMKIDRFFQQSKVSTSDGIDTGTPLLKESSENILENPAETTEVPCTSPYSPQQPTIGPKAASSKDIQPKHQQAPLGTLVLDEETNASAIMLSPDQPATTDCPICGGQVCIVDNNALNRHIDACLNGTMVRQAVREESARAECQRKNSSSRSVKDFFRADS